MKKWIASQTRNDPQADHATFNAHANQASNDPENQHP
jgi:hypothetical protein